MTTIFIVALTIATLLSISLLWIIIMHHRKQKRIEKMQAAFHDVASAFKLSVSDQDLLGERIIGLDEARRNLLFFTNKKDGYIVDLNDVKASIVKKEYGLIFPGYSRAEGVKTGISKIGLELLYKNGNSPLLLTFYDSNHDEAFEAEQRAMVADKWHNKLSEMLKPGHGHSRANIRPGCMWMRHKTLDQIECHIKRKIHNRINNQAGFNF